NSAQPWGPSNSTASRTSTPRKRVLIGSATTRAVLSTSVSSGVMLPILPATSFGSPILSLWRARNDRICDLNARLQTLLELAHVLGRHEAQAPVDGEHLLVHTGVVGED